MWHVADVTDPSNDAMWQLTVYYLTQNFATQVYGKICGSGAGLTKPSRRPMPS